MKKSNVINVTSPTFFVNRKDPRDVSYDHKDLGNWKFVQAEWYGFNPKLRKTDFLYIYEKYNDIKGFRGALITPSHLKI